MENKNKEIILQSMERMNEEFANVNEDFFYIPISPTKFDKDDLNLLLIHCTKIGASDIHIEGGNYIFVDIHSKLYPITVRPLYFDEAARFLKKIYDENAITKITSLEAIDTNYSLKNGSDIFRFRINAIGTMRGGEKTIQITIRTLAAIPPNLHLVNRGEPLVAPPGSLALERDIWENFAPDQGMILVTGPTGSGKSTLLAAGIRTLVEQRDFNRKIVTYEAPIEYVFDRVKKPSSIVTQTEIGTQLPNFYSGVETAMRRKPDIIFIGESRDIETIDSSIMASQTGHLLYSTTHTNSAAETLKRLINVFPENERQSKLMDLVDSLQMIIAQRLLKTVDGKRCAVKEFIVFDSDVKKILKEANPINISRIVDGIVREKRQRLIDDAYTRLQEGLISEETFKQCERSWGKHFVDAEDIFSFDEHNIKFFDRSVFIEMPDFENSHVGIVLSKNSLNYGNIAVVSNTEMSLDEFKENSESSFCFTLKDDEKITNKEILIQLKRLFEDYKSNK